MRKNTKTPTFAEKAVKYACSRTKDAEDLRKIVSTLTESMASQIQMEAMEQVMSEHLAGSLYFKDEDAEPGDISVAVVGFDFDPNPSKIPTIYISARIVLEKRYIDGFDFDGSINTCDPIGATYNPIEEELTWNEDVSKYKLKNLDKLLKDIKEKISGIVNSLEDQ